MRSAAARSTADSGCDSAFDDAEAEADAVLGLAVAVVMPDDTAAAAAAAEIPAPLPLMLVLALAIPFDVPALFATVAIPLFCAELFVAADR